MNLIDLSLSFLIFCVSEKVKVFVQNMSSKLPPIPCSGWCYTEAEDDIVYDYAWTIERFSRAAANYRTGRLGCVGGGHVHDVLHRQDNVL